MTKFFNKLKKTLFMACFWPTFAILGAKIFFKKIRLSYKTSYRFLATFQYLVKTTDTIPRKRPNWHKDRRTDRPYFIGSFRLPRGSKSQISGFQDSFSYISSHRRYSIKKLFIKLWNIRPWARSFIKKETSTRTFFTVCSYHVTHAFQRGSTLYSWLNVKGLLAQAGAKSEV